MESYTHLTEKDMNKIYARNKKNHYGISVNQLRYYGGKYRKAKEKGDFRTTEYIEYLLTDINFHHECSLLSSGKYEQFFEELKNW